jgi:subtilisin
MKPFIRFTSLLVVFAFISSCIQKDEFIIDEQLQLKKGDIGSTVSDGTGISQIIKDHYIVVFKEHVTNPAMEADMLGRLFGMETGHVYEHALKGFSAYIPSQALRGLVNHPLIEYIEPDITMMAFAQTVPTGISRIEANNSTLTNVDVDVAVIDTGVDTSHPDLNVVGGVRYYLGRLTDSKYNDDNGHGSHVAGTIAAHNNGFGVVGIVPGARIWAVKVLNSQGSGYMSDIVKGVDWVTRNAGTIAVANMSLGGQGVSTALRTAIKKCVAAGVVMVVAAGNSKVDVYGNDGVFGTSDDYIPAAYPEAATISALCDTDGKPGGDGNPHTYGADDSFASFSNFSRSVVAKNPVSSDGAAIDLILPGVSIYSTYKSGGYATASGTSMASPHAAGLAALHISKNLRATDSLGVYAIRQALINAGKAQIDALGLINDGDPDPNKEKLGWAGNATPVDNQPPVADFTFTISGMTVYFKDISGDDDGTIEAWSWNFGNDATSTIQNPSHAYTADGTYTVSLTVTDNGGKTASVSHEVTVPQVAQEFTLIAAARTVRTKRYADLEWAGSSAALIEIYRDDVKIKTVSNTGAYTDNLSKVTGTTFTYHVCEAGGTPCSNESLVEF